MEKQYMMYPGTRKEISLHPRNGSYPLGDAYATSVLPCFHANMLSMLTKKARPFIWYFSIWPRGFLSSYILKLLGSTCDHFYFPAQLSLTVLCSLLHPGCPSPAVVCCSHSVVTPLLVVYSLHFG
ncbi:hypothetical protein ACRRTK_007530 [Alexandromys fortis]